MFYRIIAVFLIPLTLGINLSKMFVFAGFELNRAYIAEKLCENKERPWLHCNGRCYLAKKIRQAEEKEKSRDLESRKNLMQDSVAPDIFHIQTPEVRIFNTTFAALRSRSQGGYPPSVFQPPSPWS